MKYYFLILCFLAEFTSIYSKECSLIHHVALGPEVYGVERMKHGGTRQFGTLAGIRLTYDRLKRCGWYVGGDALYATGTIDGRSGSESKIRSSLTDKYIEGRFGYTFQQKNGCRFLFTPFVGIGCFQETNDFKHPSPIPVHFQNTFSYIPFGFLSHLYLNERLGLGLKLTVRYLFKQHNKVTNDPEHDDMILQYKEELQYRLEFPITYDTCFCDRSWRIALTPFFEYRPYGELANFPFDFLDTKFRIFGASLQLVLLL